MSRIKELREITGLSQTKFGEYLHGIPLRSIQNWESGVRKCPEYLEKLIEEKVLKDYK